MTVRVGLVGAGYWGKNLARNFYQLGALAAVVDGNEALLNGYRDQYPGVDCYEHIDAVLTRADIGAIAIAAPAALHADLAARALDAGKHVFVEKPLALTVADGRRLVQQAADRNCILMVGHLLQYHPAIERLRALLADGVLGKLRYISSNRLNLGKIRTEENALWSFAPHDISVILALAGDLPDAVQCTGESHVTDGVADTTLTAMRFSSGLRAHIHVSWLYPFKEQKLTVVGEKALVVFDDTRPWSEKLSVFHHPVSVEDNVAPRANKPEPDYQRLDEGEPLGAECQHFLECCTNGRTPRSDGAEGLRVLRVLDAAQRSLEQEGLTVRPNLPSDVMAHPTAVVDPGAEVGAGTSIWHFCHVSARAHVGANCSLGQNVFIADDVRLGDGCKVQNNVSVYTGVVCEDQVFLGPSMVFTNVINPRCEVARRDEYRETTICHGVSIGANATIVCGIEIGRYAFIGAGAVVTKSVPAHALMVGNPARQVGWMSAHGERLELPLTSASGEVLTAECPGSGVTYQLNGGDLTAIEA